MNKKKPFLFLLLYTPSCTSWDLARSANQRAGAGAGFEATIVCGQR